MYPLRACSYGAILVACLCCSSLLTGAKDIMTHPTEGKALKAIKRSLIDPNKNLSNWNRGDPCMANWTGVLCFNNTLDDGYLHVRELQLFKMKLSGSLSPELGRLSFMKILDFMWNNISGSIPKEIGNIKSLELLLLNGNQLSGSLPEELGYLPNLNRIQIDQNQISGPIPKSFANLNKTQHFHMNDNSISGQIPAELSILPNLLHFLLDNNNLSGYLPPEFSKLPNLHILQLDNNNFSGSAIPSSYGSMSKLLKINLSNNKLTGTIPVNFSGLPRLQKLLEGNSICNDANLVKFCRTKVDDESNSPSSPSSTNSIGTCPSQSCPYPYEYSKASPEPCFCAAPLIVGYRLKSPGFSDFIPYKSTFQAHLTSGLDLDLFQLDIDSFACEKGPRLRMYLKLFPLYVKNQTLNKFDKSEVLRIREKFLSWTIHHNDIFGPYEVLNFTLLDPYRDEIFPSSKCSISKGALVGITIGAIAVSVSLSAIVSLLILRNRIKDYHLLSRSRRSSKSSIKIDGVKSFTYGEMALATNNFSSSSEVGRGGYGKVYKGILTDGKVVAIKRAQEGSLQGEKEFLTEIELLSRLHHRNLVSLVGYCDDEREQMLVYEFMSNGNLRDQLSARSKEPLSFAMRLKLALGSARGILYLHTEVNPPIFHRDIKASNILLGSKFIAKVADFGLSRLAPVPDIEGTVPAHVSTVVKGTPTRVTFTVLVLYFWSS